MDIPLLFMEENAADFIRVNRFNPCINFINSLHWQPISGKADQLVGSHQNYFLSTHCIRGRGCLNINEYDTGSKYADQHFYLFVDSAP